MDDRTKAGRLAIDNRAWRNARRHACIAMIIGLIGTVMTSADARPKFPPTDYVDMHPEELVTAYKETYMDAGFVLAREDIIQDGAPVGGNIISLIFEFPLPGYVNKKVGIASIRIVSRFSEAGTCAPCSVHAETHGKDWERYDAVEWANAMPGIIAAGDKATSSLKRKFDTRIRPPLSSAVRSEEE